MFDRAFYNNKQEKQTMDKVNKVKRVYLKEINDQIKKDLPEQLEDIKIAGAQLLGALDKMISHLPPLDDKFEPDKIVCNIDDKKVDCELLSNQSPIE